jgi:predicted ribonuclease YlaK
MINAEVNAYSDRLRTLAAELDLTRRLFGGAGACLVPDTSFYIEHGEKIEEVDFHDLAQSSGPVRMLIPIVVVDELDALKRGSASKTRWRAGYSLAVIDRVIVDPPRPGILYPKEHMPPRGEVTFQIIFDPPGHQRMSINDDEIVARSLACQPFADNLTVITYDTGQSTRARAAGLKVNKLSHDLGEEPGA